MCKFGGPNSRVYSKINILPIKGGNFGKDKEFACFVIVQLFHLLDVLCSFEIF